MPGRPVCHAAWDFSFNMATVQNRRQAVLLVKLLGMRLHYYIYTQVAVYGLQCTVGPQGAALQSCTDTGCWACTA